MELQNKARTFLRKLLTRHTKPRFGHNALVMTQNAADYFARHSRIDQCQAAQESPKANQRARFHCELDRGSKRILGARSRFTASMNAFGLITFSPPARTYADSKSNSFIRGAGI